MEQNGKIIEYRIGVLTTFLDELKSMKRLSIVGAVLITAVEIMVKIKLDNKPLLFTIWLAFCSNMWAIYKLGKEQMRVESEIEIANMLREIDQCISAETVIEAELERSK